MKFKFTHTPIALAVMALGTSPLIYAEPVEYEDFKSVSATSSSSDSNTTSSNTTVSVNKDIAYQQDLDITGSVQINGNIELDSSSAAIIDDSQVNYLNNNTGYDSNGAYRLEGGNVEVTNSTTVDGTAFSGATGNIGLNITSGDNNQQANVAALAAADASFLFGSADAEIMARQDVQLNHTNYIGNTNISSLGGDAFSNATGNIGVNISSGNSNQQKNDLAASVAVARMSTATVSVKQLNDHNTTSNSALHRRDGVESVEVDLNFSATGQYAGIVDQNGNLYPDIWDNEPGDAPVHPTDEPGPTQHADFDSVAQGASDRPVSSGLDGNGEPNGDLSNGGALGFNEQGDIALSGTVTGLVPVSQHIVIATTNTSSLGGNAFSGAAGNIGVNIASGTNNQQHNGLAISSTQPGIGVGGGSTGEF